MASGLAIIKFKIHLFVFLCDVATRAAFDRDSPSQCCCFESANILTSVVPGKNLTNKRTGTTADSNRFRGQVRGNVKNLSVLIQHGRR